MTELIQAFQKDEALLVDIGKAKMENGFHVWWLGQSGFLLQWEGKHLLFDPYLSDSLTEKYTATDKPHIRMSELVMQPGKLDFMDIVTSSHNHTDHLDADTLIPLMHANPSIKLVIPEANRAFVSNRIQRTSDYPIGLNAKEKIALNGFLFHGIPAAHNRLERDDQGNCLFMGYVVQFGPYTIYHSGDTLWHTEILDALRHFNIDLAILPINGNKPERRVAGNLDAHEAVELTKFLNIKMMIPCHYHMFTFNSVDPDVFRTIAEKHQIPFKILKGGERWSCPW